MGYAHVFYVYLNKCYGPNQPPTHFFFAIFYVEEVKYILCDSALI